MAARSGAGEAGNSGESNGLSAVAGRGSEFIGPAL